MCSTGCVTPLTCLGGALEALAGQDLTSSFGPTLLDRTRALVVARNRLDAELARHRARG